MNSRIFDRTRLLLGDEAMKRIGEVRVAVFGIGGVGSWVAEALVRSGVSHLTIIDNDIVDITNVNRQMPATSSTIGEIKVEVAKRRLLEINPDAKIDAMRLFYTADTAGLVDVDSFDYVVDAIDSLKDKALLILNATQSRAKLFSSMGAALKIDPTKISVAEFWNVKGCPLARALRQRFKRDKTFPSRKFLCVYSDELLANKGTTDETCSYKASINGSLAHVTAIFGMTLAGEILMDIVKTCDTRQ